VGLVVILKRRFNEECYFVFVRHAWHHAWKYRAVDVGSNCTSTRCIAFSLVDGWSMRGMARASDGFDRNKAHSSKSLSLNLPIKYLFAVIRFDGRSVGSLTFTYLYKAEVSVKMSNYV
jgi:hypothetical protein